MAKKIKRKLFPKCDRLSKAKLFNHVARSGADVLKNVARGAFALTR